jgi:hypothetical protein
MLGCKVFGHRFRFRADGSVMSWTCARGCGAGGAKSYADDGAAARYARAFDSDSSRDRRRAPLFALLPLRLLDTFRRRRRLDEG